jgi:hypothetical protein
LLVADRLGLTEEDDECRLKGVLDIRRVIEDTPTGGQDQPAMSPHEGRECRFVAAGEEAGEQVRVAERALRGPVGRGADVAEECGECGIGHRGPLGAFCRSLWE